MRRTPTAPVLLMDRRRRACRSPDRRALARARSWRARPAACGAADRLGRDAMLPARLPAVLAQELPGARIEEAHASVRPTAPAAVAPR